jgi:dihydropteroate synthase
VKDSLFCTKNTLNAGGKVLDLSGPLVMGILNSTPDSFYEQSRFQSDIPMLDKVASMLTDGADILDIGGYSSRPGAENVSAEEELGRVIPSIRAIKKEFPEAIVSVDTFRAVVAKEAIESGADMVNDISGGGLDEHMFELVAKYKVPYVMMHMKGSPQDMSMYTRYENILVEMLNYFQRRLFELRVLGVADVVLDLGFGFAKTREQNFFLLKNLRIFKMLDCPILVGLSRKSLIYKTLEIEPSEALNGTSVLNTMALLNGGAILRVHDVKEARQAIKLVSELKG